MSEQIGIKLDPSAPTPISDYGPRQIVILGKWNGATVQIERRLPEHAGDPSDGNWTGCPSRDASGRRILPSPSTAMRCVP